MSHHSSNQTLDHNTYPLSHSAKMDLITITSPQNIDNINTQTNANVLEITALKGHPRLIGLCSINPLTHRTHRFGWGDGYNNGSATHNDNTFYYIDANFKVNFQPLGAIVNYKIKCVMDAFYSSRAYYFAVGTSALSSSIIPTTITFFKGRNSEWTSNKEVIQIYESGLVAGSSQTRYVFCKEVATTATNVIASTAGNQGWVIYGGRNVKNVATQANFYWESDATPDLPNDTDNFGALEIEVWSAPTGYATTASAVSHYQYLEY